MTGYKERLIFMNELTTKEPKINLENSVNEILKAIDQDREREIITRRFGLFDRRETLEQIGDLLGITRERVRQLEKSILSKLKTAAENGKISVIPSLEKVLIRELSENGRVARVSDLTDLIVGRTSSQIERSRVAFIATLSPHLTVLDQNDYYYQSVGISEYDDVKKMKEKIDSIVSVIRKQGQPMTPEQIHEKLDFEHPSYIKSMASLSKLLANLNNKWGLAKWPTVNPKNIRDKIYVILEKNNKPMHFSEIAKSIKNSEFKRKDVTTQAIHNELIKDKRFVLIGRGIYALESWGFDKGTVADVIAKVLKKASEPLHRDEIVRRVLKSRQVKETTILLNLQSKPQFKRVAKATYTLNSPEK